MLNFVSRHTILFAITAAVLAFLTVAVWNSL